jgi:hypothetical protein
MEVLRSASPARALRAARLLRRPIVIGGCGRSGTTMMLSVLSCHPHVFAIGDETMALCPLGYTNPDEVPDTLAPIRPDLLLRHMAKQPIPWTARRACEKTPRNVHYFPSILRFWGDRVRLIHMVRDPRDVITSRHPERPDGYWVSPRRWIHDVQAGRTMEGHPQLLTVRYEDLTSDYEGVMRKVCTFIDEDFTPRFLDYPETARLAGGVEGKAWFGPRRRVEPTVRVKSREHDARIEQLLEDPLARDHMAFYGYE